MMTVTRVDLGRVEVVTMRELTLRTGAVIERLRAEGVPRVVVKHGRFQAALWPLPPGVEADLLSAAVESGDLSLQGSTGGARAQDLIARSSGAAGGEDQSGPGPAVTTAQRPNQTFATATMSQLSQQPSTVISRVRDGERLIVTRHGRFVAILVPLPPNLESQLLASVPDFLATLDAGHGAHRSGMPVDIARAWHT